MLSGSWGKLTRVRPVRDIDVLFVLPYSVYQRFQQVALGGRMDFAVSCG